MSGQGWHMHPGGDIHRDSVSCRYDNCSPVLVVPVEKDAPCGCRWERDTAGHLDLRECSEHYVTRVTPPAVPEGGRDDG